MTNYELIRSASKEELAVLLSQITFGANDYPFHIKDIYKWFDNEAENYNNTNPKEELEIITNRYYKYFLKWDNTSKPEGEQDNG